MREPVSWLASWYRYRRRSTLLGHRNATHDVTFEEFVQAYLMEGKIPPFANVGSQVKFLESRPNGVGITHLFRYEDQPRLLTFIKDRLGHDITLDRRNVSPVMELELSADTLKDLHTKCAAEFELYDSLP